jgi:uncharacterized protein (DUF2141 family)
LRLAGATLLAAALLASATAPAAAVTLVVRAEGVDVGKGSVRVAVCARGFDEAGCPRGANRPADAAALEFVFRDMPAGRYAVAAYQDVNGDGELGKIPPGIPTEPYGFSNDVGRWAPPSFEKAQFEVGGDRTTVVIRLRRLLGR